MSVRKRVWRNADGSQGEAWAVSYTDQDGRRRLKSFKLKRDADAYHASVATDLRSGLHVPDATSITIAAASQLWLQSAAGRGLEPATLLQYRSRLTCHILPLLGAVKLSRLTAPMVRAFEDKLAELGCSPTMVREVRGYLGNILADAQERGLVAQNVVHAVRRQRGGSEARTERRQKGKLKVGVDIPSPDEIRRFIHALNGRGRWRPFFLTAIFTGLRVSELRGLRWDNVDLKAAELHVRQRADIFCKLGRPKSAAGERTVPIPPIVVAALREHRLACQSNALNLVFPNTRGKVDSLNSVLRYGLKPTMVAAGITDSDGQPKYTGMHSLRHFYCSWCINRRADGGLELPLKLVQARMGHASIKLTADHYGHLFPRGDDGAELAAAERAFFEK